MRKRSIDTNRNSESKGNHLQTADQKLISLEAKSKIETLKWLKTDLSKITDSGSFNPVYPGGPLIPYGQRYTERILTIEKAIDWAVLNLEQIVKDCENK